jgi:hypothetical protein
VRFAVGYLKYIFNNGKGPFLSKMEKEGFTENAVFESTFS